MDSIRRLVPSIQRPRFRGEGQSSHDAPAPDRRIYQTGVLCTFCKNTFARSRIIFGSKTGLISSLEFHKLSPSLGELKRSALELHCHFCTLVWGQLASNHTPVALDRAKGGEITLRFRKRRIRTYCELDVEIYVKDLQRLEVDFLNICLSSTILLGISNFSTLPQPS
jgi:hypothetical protein